MSVAVKLSNQIIADAKISSKALNRSIAGQIEHWAKIGQLVEQNKDLSYEAIIRILIAKQEAQRGELEDYVFDSK